MDKKIFGKTVNEWIEHDPVLKKVMELKEVFWLNSHLQTFPIHNPPIDISRIVEAEDRLNRFSPLIKKAFDDTASSKGIIESELFEMPEMKRKIEELYAQQLEGRFLIKGDHSLPIAGSIKARGGIYEVLKIAESIARKNGLKVEDDYSIMLTDSYRNLFSRFKISVGSTGNLGLSIGIMATKLGFCVTVHMSKEAKQWKKDLLREKGAIIVEHEADYSSAVEAGRYDCQQNPNCFFIDDENSIDLFLGYSVAALRLQKQLEERNILVDADHPLFVYLPCGVGGGPGGIAYCLKYIFGEHVHCFFAEPTHSPCMLLGLVTGKHEEVSVQDFGLDNQTAADGLAVGRPSGFVSKTVGPMLTGLYTVDDDELYKLLYCLYSSEGLKLEPSALAGMYGPIQLFRANFLNDNFSEFQLKNSTHIVWATGGSLVPEPIMDSYIKYGKALM